ncbi:MAG: DUF1207 domain-containing protein, partial [Nanoarchaeota archaeon]
EKPLSENPYAYPLSPSMGFSLVQNLKTEVSDFNIVLGKRIPFVTLDSIGNSKLQFVIDAAVWSTLRQDSGNAYKLLFSDYLISFPVVLQYGNLTHEFKFTHVSAHLSDGIKIERLMYKFSYSRDYFSYLFAYKGQLKQQRFQGTRYQLVLQHKEYIEIGWIHKIFPKELDRRLLHFGNEFTVLDLDQRDMNFYTAWDLTPHPSLSPKISYSIQLGIMTNTDNLYTMRLALIYYNGFDFRGQQLGRELQYVGFALYIR